VASPSSQLDIAGKRVLVASLSLFSMASLPAIAEVTGVTIESQHKVADGRPLGVAGSYEELTGRIQFALDPTDAHNRGIVDLEHAKRDGDGLVRFSADLHVLRPVDTSKGNGVLLFGIANRGREPLIGRFNLLHATAIPGADSSYGDGLLMRDGYTLVSVGWEFDVPASLLHIDAPRATLPAGADDRLAVEVMYNAHAPQGLLIDDPAGRPPVIYPPMEFAGAGDVLTVRDRYWDQAQIIPRDRWRFVASRPPKIELDGRFEPGRYYRVTYRATEAVSAGVGVAAIRDAAAAFRYRTDLPIRGRSAYAFGVSQSGRFMRQFLYEGFNLDERDRRVFDAVWIHVAGAARGPFNERFATPVHGDMFRPMKFPFADAEQVDVDGTRDGLLSHYLPNQRPKIFYTNTPVEYWGGGRAAALTHTSVDGMKDLKLPDNVRMYFLAGTQHIEVPFPPPPRGQRPSDAAAAGPRGRNDGQQLVNPMPQSYVMRALLRALHDWTANGTLPPASRYPRLSDGTMVPIRAVKFPAIPGVADPRRIEGPARTIAGKVAPLPHLVPQVDRDGNELAGIRYPEVAVPLATTTGWNFRDPSVGNSGILYQTLGSYIPFPATKAARRASTDPRSSIEERYRGLDDYLQRVRVAALELIRGRYLLEEDLDAILARARAHWIYATSRQVP
jgi:Alpha/beta hydrolase domain